MNTIKIENRELKVKDQSDWKGDFNEDFKPGEYVDQKIVDYFRDVLPPRSMGIGYLQVGEPYNHTPDQEGRYRATYNTFTFTGEAPNVWKYCGHCFAGEMKHRG